MLPMIIGFWIGFRVFDQDKGLSCFIMTAGAFAYGPWLLFAMNPISDKLSDLFSWISYKI